LCWGGEWTPVIQKNIVVKTVNDIIHKWDSKKLKSDILNQKNESNPSLRIGIRLVNYRDIDRFIKNSKEADNIAEEILKQADAFMYLAKETYKKASDKNQQFILKLRQEKK
jgi:GGDEF domain-containing protein